MSVALTCTVATGCPLISTSDDASNPRPRTVRMSVDEPAATDVGRMESTTGGVIMPVTDTGTLAATMNPGTVTLIVVMPRPIPVASPRGSTPTTRASKPLNTAAPGG